MPLALQVALPIILAIVILAKALVVVPRGKVFVVAMLGRPAGVLNAGVHFMVPFVSTITARIPVDEQMLDVPETAGRLEDGTPVSVKGSIRYRVTNPIVAITDVADYQHALAELARTHWLRALETSDVLHFESALQSALPAIRSAAATWGIEAIDATTLMTMSEEGMRQLEQQASLEREQRVLQWLAERGELPGSNGRPTLTQHAAYKAWTDQALAEHREEIEAAARDAASKTR
jgi:regulator of protease activity HflC (stomatin/prohibitin superfamily)